VVTYTALLRLTAALVVRDRLSHSDYTGQSIWSLCCALYAVTT